MSSIGLYRRLLTYSFKYWRALAVAVLGMVATAATETAFPALMKQLMDSGFQQSERFPIWWVPIAILLLFIGRGIASFVALYTMEWVSNSVLRDIRQAMFEKMIYLPSSAFDSRSAGQFISQIMSEAQMVLFAATNVLSILIKDSLIILGLLSWLLYLNWKLTLVVLILMPPLALVTKAFSKRMRRVSKRSITANRQMTAIVEEAVSGNRVIKVYSGGNYEKKRFSRINAELRGQAMRYATAVAIQTPMSQFIASMGVAVVVTIALMQAQDGGATVGDFVSFITAMLLMFSPLKHLAEVNAQIQKGLAAAENVFKLLDDTPEADMGHQTVTRVEGNITFEGVSLKYPGRELNALDKVTLKIPAGKTYALVGPSGSGKTSLVNLLPRIYEPTDGKISIDGRNIHDLKLESLRNQIALVSQDVVLFNDTIANNISYGRSEISQEKLNEAISFAALDEFINSLPQGVDTVIGDRGVQLSGGQRQRIAIARALIKDAPILIFDEATSALDTKSEYLIQLALEKLRRNRTTLVVAHRLSTVFDADQIIVMSDGKIVQEGRHEDLVEIEGLYRTLYDQMQVAKPQNDSFGANGV